MAQLNEADWQPGEYDYDLLLMLLGSEPGNIAGRTEVVPAPEAGGTRPLLVLTCACSVSNSHPPASERRRRLELLLRPAQPLQRLPLSLRSQS